MGQQVEHLDWRSVIKAGDDTPPDVLKALDDYFAPFAAVPLKKEDGRTVLDQMPCVKCGEVMNDWIMSLMGFSKGGFEWGIAHGEGHCRNCGWPARAHHFIKDKDGETLMTVRNVVLQYHPDFVQERKRGAA